MYTHIHVYIHICIHTCIHIHAHMYTCVCIYLDCFYHPDIDFYSDKCRIQNGAFYKGAKPCCNYNFWHKWAFASSHCYVLLKDRMYFLKTELQPWYHIHLGLDYSLLLRPPWVHCRILSTSLAHSLDATCILPVITTQSTGIYSQTSLCVVCVCVCWDCEGLFGITTSQDLLL